MANPLGGCAGEGSGAGGVSVGLAIVGAADGALARGCAAAGEPPGFASAVGIGLSADGFSGACGAGGVTTVGDASSSSKSVDNSGDASRIAPMGSEAADGDGVCATAAGAVATAARTVRRRRPSLVIIGLDPRGRRWRRPLR